MKITVAEDYTAMSAIAAAHIVNCLRNKPDALLCFASGETPKLAYQLVAEKVQQDDIDLNHAFFIGLDEWLGIPPENTGSCHYFLQENLFKPTGIDPTCVHLFDALTANEQKECAQMDKLIDRSGGIDLMVVGVGMNGHIGFNEPGADVDAAAHVIELDDTTKTVGKKYFDTEVPINKGITIGMKQVLQAKTLLLIANGKKKAPIIQKALEGEISNQFPASLIRQHNNVIVLIDKEAASELQPTTP